MCEKTKLKIAAIMDEFTYTCYAPECELLQVTPDGFQSEIMGFGPDMLFIESAWRGKDNLWRFKLHDDTTALNALTSFCCENGIPVVFWCKEDPVHFGVFVRTASFADYVFTTDADCIELYKAYLGHDRVYYLPFAAQPAIHNPVEEYERKDRFCFAGSFYVKYQERSRTFMELVPLFKERGLDIYDRNFHKSETDNNTQTTSVASPATENYCFPAELKDCILGGLPYSQISLAYKGYRYGVNMTSMVQSGYMFARRAFELMACNTVTVSNYSRGLELFFGDLLIATDDRETMRKRLDDFCGTEEKYRKYRLAGLRYVLASHLYEDRIDYVVHKALRRSVKRPMPEILVVCFEESESVREMFERQTYEKKHLLFFNGDKAVHALEFDYITVFSPDDYYGKNYLLDFALSTRFADDAVIGKAAYYSDGELRFGHKAYKRVFEPVTLTRQMAAKSFFGAEVLLSELKSFHPKASVLSLDEFNYCENATECAEADDLDIRTGVPLEEIYDYTEHIRPVALHKTVQIPTAELFEQVRIQEEDMVKKAYSGTTFILEREADDDKIVWLRTDKNYDIAQFTTGSRLGFYTEVSEKVGNVRCQIEYYDGDGVKLGFLNFSLDGFSLMRISDRAKTFKLIFRLRGKARVSLTAMYASSPDSLLAAPFPVRDSLLITEDYPSYASPDKLSELHRFAKKNRLEVLLVGDKPKYLPYSEYEGVQVIASQYGAVKEYLGARSFRKIYMCCPSEKVLDSLKGYTGVVEQLSL